MVVASFVWGIDIPVAVGVGAFGFIHHRECLWDDP